MKSGLPQDITFHSQKMFIWTQCNMFVCWQPISLTSLFVNRQMKWSAVCLRLVDDILTHAHVSLAKGAFEDLLVGHSIFWLTNQNKEIFAPIGQSNVPLLRSNGFGTQPRTKRLFLRLQRYWVEYYCELWESRSSRSFICASFNKRSDLDCESVAANRLDIR